MFGISRLQHSLKRYLHASFNSFSLASQSVIGSSVIVYVFSLYVYNFGTKSVLNLPYLHNLCTRYTVTFASHRINVCIFNCNALFQKAFHWRYFARIQALHWMQYKGLTFTLSWGVFSFIKKNISTILLFLFGFIRFILQALGFLPFIPAML